MTEETPFRITGEIDIRSLTMTEEPEKKCDIDCIMQEMQALSYLEGMKNLLGTESFQKRYPEFVGLDDVVKERMTEQRLTLKETMKRCGIDTTEFEEEMISEEAEPQEKPVEG